MARVDPRPILFREVVVRHREKLSGSACRRARRRSCQHTVRECCGESERSCTLKADVAKALLTIAAWSQVMSMLPIAWRVARAMASIVVSRVRSSTSARCDSKNLLAESMCESNVLVGVLM